MARASVIPLLCFLFSGIAAKDRVPVLIWNSNQVQDGIPAVPALQTIDYATFQSKYLSTFGTKNIILFILDALSVEDLSSHSLEFEPLTKWLGESHYLYLPNVEEAAYLPHDLASHGYKVVSLEPGVPVSGLTLKEEDNNLVVVKLPSTLTHPSRSRALQKAVEVMQNVISKIGAMMEFTFIFTGMKPSVEDSSSKYEGRVRVPRAAIMPTERGFHSQTCVMMYFKKNFTLNIYDSSTPDGVTSIIFDDQSSDDFGHCDKTEGPEKTARLSLKFLGGVKPFSKLQLTFNFKAMSRSWAFTDVEVLVNAVDQTNLKLVSPDISGIPVGMSYSCSQPVYLVSNTNTTSPDKRMELIMKEVQMEAFFDPTMRNSTFGPAWDCVGFFTVPIWVSLITTFLLLVILTTGLFMLSDIKTMDRFDDPKGQPIMVPSSE